MKFAFIQQHLTQFPVDMACQVLQVSRSGYYIFRGRRISARKHRREQLASKIRSVHEANRRVYGSPRVWRALREQGEAVCENTVAKVMRMCGIRWKTRRKFVPRTTQSTYDQPVAANVLARRFEVDRPDRKWAADITYVPTDEGWLYVAGVLDLCSRKMIGWAMADHMRTELVSEALQMALTHRRPDPGAGVLHHSDRGVQYVSDDYQKLLIEHGMQASMSARGSCWDNAAMESFWSTLKTELVNDAHYATREQARQSIFEYIEVFYNRQRLHSTLGYKSPEAFEAGLN